jgi:transmembrane sensor
MNSDIPKLIDKFFDGKCTVEEKLMLDEWYYSYEAESDPDELLDNGKRRAFEALMLERINNNILKVEALSQGPQIIRRQANVKWLVYAVSGIAAMLLITAGVYFLRPVKRDELIQRGATAGLPDQQNKLVLKMSDGKRLYLDEEVKSLKETDGTEIRIEQNSISYHNAGPGKPFAHNVLIVPTGKTYKVTLADGTAVWLNNVSQLTFPVAFKSAEDRVVELKGEAYFEVFHDASRPFKVKVNGTEITVLGTKFNVNTFRKGKVTTTLLEGSVKISGRQAIRLLKPGQEAIDDQGNISISKADLQKATAWKDGYFQFRQDEIQPILEQIARWYNIEVKYSGAIAPGLHFSGKIPRSETLDGVLVMLTDITGLKFRHTGNTVWVNSK